jgi:glycosyltransferase involved in cell wall biosynthesis
VISVIIPVYNVEKYIERCINSVRTQTYKDLEIILVDDGSKDHSGILCDSYAKTDKRIIVIHQSNKGPSEARNAGLKIARGDYIGFIDGDDWVSSDYYEHLMQIAEREDADIVSGLYKMVSGQKKNRSRHFHEVITTLEGEKILDKFLGSAIKGGVTHVSCCSKIYRRACVKNHFFDKKISYSEDLLFNWEVLNSVKKYVCTNYAGYYYFSNRNSITKKKFSRKILELYYVADKLEQIYQFDQRKIHFLLRQYRVKADFSILIKLLRTQDKDKELAETVIENVKKGYQVLIFSPLSFSRKIVLTLVKIIPQKIFIGMFMS